MKPLVRDTDTVSFMELLEWCRIYQKHGIHPMSKATRFGVGLYQLHQGMKWRNDPANKAESFMSGALHFFMTAEAYEVPLEQYPVIGNRLLITEVPVNAGFNVETLLEPISEAQQHVFYGSYITKAGYQRKSRYSPEILGRCLSAITEGLISSIPTGLRRQAVQDATSIMTKRL